MAVRPLFYTSIVRERRKLLTDCAFHCLLTTVGLGLDDPRLDPLWQSLESTKLLVFIHPHYGITAARGPESTFGPLNNGHVLPLALGFPFETTIVSTIPSILLRLSPPSR